MSEREDCRRCGGPFFVIGNIVPVIQKRSAGMHTCANRKSRRKRILFTRNQKVLADCDISNEITG